MVQKIFFSTTPNIFPKIILANSVYINAPNCHFTRTPNEYIIYFILDGKMILKEDTNIYNLKTVNDYFVLVSFVIFASIANNLLFNHIIIKYLTSGMVNMNTGKISLNLLINNHTVKI